MAKLVGREIDDIHVEQQRHEQHDKHDASVMLRCKHHDEDHEVREEHVIKTDNYDSVLSHPRIA